MDVTWLAVVGLWMVMLLTADVADSLACYNCDSTNKICSANEIRGQKILQVNCPNADDECGMAFTIHPATGHRRILNRTCWTTHELRHYDQLRRGGGDRGSVGGLLVRVASNERRGLFELVELRLSHCNRSLCNSRYPDVSNQVATPLECYFCSSVDNPACDFGGIDLKQMNDTVLARCPSVGGPFHCALSYKTRRMSHQPQQPKQQKPRKMDRVVVVSRTCLSDDDLASYKRQLGADLVGVDSADSSVETHLFVCSDVSGCNWRFSDVAAGRATGEGAKKEEEEEVTSCYECNNEGNSSSTCSLESANISQMEENGKRDDKKEREEGRWRQGKRRLIRECPVEQSYGCVIWYKVRLETQDVAAVVRSCLSRDDANRYRANYAAAAAAATSSVADRATTVGPLSPLSEERGSSVEVYWKEDGSQRAIYFLAMCFRSLCNLRFPDFEPVTRLCFVCSQDADDACDATGNRLSSATHLRHCPDPSDLCSLSYVVGLGRTGDQLLRPSAVRRSCISQRRAAEYQRHLSTDDGDLVVISGGSDVIDQSISDIHLFLCWSSKCNRRLPDGLRDSAPAPGLTCYTCSSSQQQHPQQPEESTANEEDGGGDACGAQLTPEEGAAFVSRCAARRGARREEEDEGGVGDDERQVEEQRCFMSYVLAADGSQSHFNRSCISVAEILSLKRRFGPDLISTDLGPHLHRYMFHCSASLCNRQFPPTATTANKRSPINCFICSDSHASSISSSSISSSSSSSSSSSASSDCGVDGSELSRSLLLPCSVFERFFCAVVARFNASSPGALLLVSMRRHCISERDAVAYMSKGDRLELGLKDAGDIVVYEERARKAGAAAAGTAGSFKNFLFICRSDGCNAQFPQLKDVVQRHLAETPIGVSGPVINEKNSKKTDDYGDEELDEQQSPRTGASHSTAQRPILALGGHLTTAVALIIAASALDR